MRCPLVSVIIPCFNTENYLREAIESALNQNYPSIEIIVVDDGSTDASAQVAERFDGVQLIKQTNQGVAVARNIGFAASRGEYVTFLDSDDRLLPDAIRIAIDAAASLPSDANAWPAFVFGRFRQIDRTGRVMRTQHERSQHLTYRMLLRGDALVPPGSALFPRTLIAAVGGFDPNLRLAEDYDFYFRICRFADGYCHNAVTVEYRQHPGQSSYGVSNILKATLTVLENQREAIQNEKSLLADQTAGRKAWSRLFGQWIPIEIVRHVKTRKIADARRATWQFCRHSPSTLAGAMDLARARLMNGGMKRP